MQEDVLTSSSFFNAGCSLLGWTPPTTSPSPPTVCLMVFLVSVCLSSPLNMSLHLSLWVPGWHRSKHGVPHERQPTEISQISESCIILASRNRPSPCVCVWVSGGAEGAAWSLQTSNAEITHVITVIADFTSADLRLRHQLSSLLSAGRLSSLCGDRRCSMQAIRERNWITA